MWKQRRNFYTINNNIWELTVAQMNFDAMIRGWEMSVSGFRRCFQTSIEMLDVVEKVLNSTWNLYVRHETLIFGKYHLQLGY